MGTKTNLLSAFTIVLICLSLLAFKPTDALTIPEPSVPQFTIEYVDHSYDIPPVTTSTINPYSGKTETTTTPGQHVENFTLDLTIKNQPFLSSIGGNASYLYYNVRFKGHFGGDWNYPFSSFPKWASSTGGALDGDYSEALPKQPDSQYTVFSFPANYNAGDEVDFQVEAILAVQYSETTYFYNGESHLLPIQENTFVYESSDWSPSQTFKMPQTSPSTSSSSSSTQTPSPIAPNPTPDQTSLVALGLAAAVVAVCVVSLIYFKRQRKNKLTEN